MILRSHAEKRAAREKDCRLRVFTGLFTAPVGLEEKDLNSNVTGSVFVAPKVYEISKK